MHEIMIFTSALINLVIWLDCWWMISRLTFWLFIMAALSWGPKLLMTFLEKRLHYSMSQNLVIPAIQYFLLGGRGKGSREIRGGFRSIAKGCPAELLPDRFYSAWKILIFVWNDRAQGFALGIFSIIARFLLQNNKQFTLDWYSNQNFNKSDSRKKQRKEKIAFEKKICHILSRIVSNISEFYWLLIR